MRDIEYHQAPTRVTVAPRKMNKTEGAYWDRLQTLVRGGLLAWCGYEVVTFKLAHDTRYTPDFIIITNDGAVEAHETKGFFREDALVKVKVAAEQIRWCRFFVVKKTADGWESKHVDPR